MDNLKEQIEEIEQLKAEQALHRKQLEENRQRALAKQKQTKRLVSLGKMVEELLPDDIANLPEDEIQEIFKNLLNRSSTSNFKH